MRTARLLPVFPSMHCPGGVPAQGVYPPGGCTYSGGLDGGCTCSGTPHSKQNSLHTPLKILPCPKLRLRLVKTSLQIAE